MRAPHHDLRILKVLVGTQLFTLILGVSNIVQ